MHTYTYTYIYTYTFAYVYVCIDIYLHTLPLCVYILFFMSTEKNEKATYEKL